MNRLALLMAAIMAAITIAATTAAHANEADLRGPFEHFEEAQEGPFHHHPQQQAAAIPTAAWKGILAAQQAKGGSGWQLWVAQARAFGAVCGEGHPENAAHCDAMEVAYMQDSPALLGAFIAARGDIARAIQDGRLCGKKALPSQYCESRSGDLAGAATPLYNAFAIAESEARWEEEGRR